MINRTLAQMLDLLGFDAYTLEVMAIDRDDGQGTWRGFNRDGKYCEIVIDLQQNSASVFPLDDTDAPSTSQTATDALVDVWRENNGMSRAAAYRYLVTSALHSRGEI